MPFKSAKQRNYLWAKHPDVAKRWTKKYGKKVIAKSGGVMLKQNKTTNR